MTKREVQFRISQAIDSLRLIDDENVPLLILTQIRFAAKSLERSKEQVEEQVKERYDGH